MFFICLFISFYLIKKTSSEILFTSILGGAALYLLLVTTKAFLNKNYNTSQAISHFGFSLFILSILLNSLFSTEFSSNMKIGQKLVYENEQIKFLKIKNNDKNGINNLLKKGGPMEIFSFAITSKNIG